MLQEFLWRYPDSPQIAEIFALYQMSQEFHQEVQYRQAFQAHCDWYAITAAQNQREFQKLKGDINILGWFLGSRH